VYPKKACVPLLANVGAIEPVKIRA